MTRRYRLTTCSLIVFSLLVGACAARRSAVRAPGRPAAVDAPAALAAIWDAEHVSMALPPLVRHADVMTWLDQLRRRSPDLFAVEEIGTSVEGRAIEHVTFGHGPFHVLLWSQMHGDEPSATSALFDLFEFVRRHRAEPSVQRMLDALTVHVVPMLNPDGAERFQRRNAQGIDINRDALLEQTPEGRALKGLRDRLNPPLGFNLHNQDWRTSVGRTAQPASISLLSVAFDEALSVSPGRLRTKRVCVTIRDAVEALAPGRIAKYEDEFEIRAFGDNITKWGTSVVLIETGGWPGDHADAALVRLNFVALVASLEAVATGNVDREDARRYDSLPRNGDSILYRLVRQATIVPGTGVAPFIGDIGLTVNRSVQMANGERQMHVTTRIQDLGDLRVFGALETIEARGLTVTPVFDPTLNVGDETQLPDWKNWTGNTISTGRPGDLLLLRSTSGGTFRVERILRGDMIVGSSTTNDQRR